jgi:O-antigen ligase
MRSIPFLAICGIVFVIPWEEMAVFPGVETAAKSIGYVALGLSLITVLVQLGIRRPPLALVFLGLAAAWNCLSVLWSIDVEQTTGRVMTNLSLLAFAWMIWEFADSERRVAGLFRAFVLGCCVSLGTMFASFVPGAVGQFGEVVRLTGGDLNENDIAAILNIAIVFAAYLASRSARGSRMRMVYWAFVPTAAVGVPLTGSRMGILVLIGGLTLTSVSVMSKGIRPLLPFIAVVGIGAWLMPHFMSEGVLRRVEEGTEAHSFKVRVELWQTGLAFWQSCPFEGAGAGAYRKVTELRGASRPNVAHNTFISTLVEGGLVGATLMLAFWVTVFRSIWRLPKRDRLSWLTVIAIWGAVSLSASWECTKTTWFLYGTAMAFCALPKPNLVRKPTNRVQQPPLVCR